MWVGRATVFLVGLAVILAMILGVAATALAGTGVGANFNLGKKNTVNRLSQLVGSTDNAMLRVDNDNAGTNATALNLLVEPGHTPMKVNSTTKVNSLNTDLLDGHDSSQFIKTFTYRSESDVGTGTLLGDGTFTMAASCNSGDVMLSGGPANVAPTTDIVESYPSGLNSWTARVDKNGVDDRYNVVVLCADQ